MLAVFDFNGNEVRTVLIDGEPWFVAQDVCKVLEIANSRDATQDLESDEKSVVTTDTSSQNRDMTIVSESGLYEIVFKSRKPQAKAFRKWLRKEVIPSIRKTGKYDPSSTPKLPSDILAERVAQNIGNIQDRLEQTQPRLAQFLIEVAINDCRTLMGTKLPSLPSGDELLTAQAYAEEKNFPVKLSNRSQLGKFVAKQYRLTFSSEPPAQKQELAGGLREVNVYPRSFLDKVVGDFFN